MSKMNEGEKANSNSGKCTKKGWNRRIAKREIKFGVETPSTYVETNRTFFGINSSVGVVNEREKWCYRKL